ncbi:MAG: hypothetical protein EOP04_29920, partial [Proteobacteria bacterium]
MDALELIENLKQLDIPAAASAGLFRAREDFVLLNQQQMLEGKLANGRDIYPTYFEDPYFKTPEAAKRYSDWKDKITPNPKRKKGVPNLFINGAFHNSLTLEVQDQEYLVNASFFKAEAIIDKFTEDVLGLNENNAEILIDENLETPFRTRIYKRRL